MVSHKLAAKKTVECGINLQLAIEPYNFVIIIQIFFIFIITTIS